MRCLWPAPYSFWKLLEQRLVDDIRLFFALLARPFAYFVIRSFYRKGRKVARKESGLMQLGLALRFCVR